MRGVLSIALGFTALVQPAKAQKAQCSAEQPLATAPHSNPWKALSEEDSESVTALLQQRLNLTGDGGSSRDSYVMRVNLLHPNKTDVVPFFDSGANEPARYARATVVSGTEELYWQEYMVGPLPATNMTAIQTLTYPFTNSQPGKTVVNAVYSATDGAQFQEKFGLEVEDITTQLWNTTFAAGGVGTRFATPFWEEDGTMISWAIMLGIPETIVGSTTVLPLGVSVKFDFTSRNWDDWKATGWYAGGKFYNSTEGFRAAVFSPSFEKPLANINGNWTSTDKQGDPFPLDDLPPPVSVSQGSQRFKLDTAQDYISWMDFAFYFSVSRDTGLSLHDVQYKGKRLLYELSLQDAITHYAGSDPFASETAFFDTETGMGSSLVPLVRGYDCPAHATYLNATFAEGNSTATHVDAICIFEYDTGYPIRRHAVYPVYTSVAKNIMFTVRTIATVANYDFMIEYNFFYDGAIEISARASGYISAAYWDGNPDYGFHIHDHLSGSMHDHMLTFKADFDIFGTKNSIQKVEFVPTVADYPWAPGRTYNTMKAVRSMIANESVASINWEENDAINYAIVNKDSPNRFGELPGYRMKRSAGTSHLTVINSTNTRQAATLSVNDFFITKQKDVEPRAADSYNQYSPMDPLVDFSKFLNGESLDQDDIVIWFNLGMHHLPHTGDLPNTMFSAAHSAMRFEPQNYLEGDPSVASNQQVRIDYNEDGSVKGEEHFGKKTATCALAA